MVASSSPVPVVVAKGGGRSEMIVPPQEPVITIIDANLITRVDDIFSTAVLKHEHEIDKMNVSDFHHAVAQFIRGGRWIKRQRGPSRED